MHSLLPAACLLQTSVGSNCTGCLHDQKWSPCPSPHVVCILGRSDSRYRLRLCAKVAYSAEAVEGIKLSLQGRTDLGCLQHSIAQHSI